MAYSALETEIRRRIAVAGPMPVRQYMTLCLTHPRLRLLRDPRSVRPHRRLHHLTRDQPDVRRVARAVGGRGLAPDGRAGERTVDRAWSRPRHDDRSMRCAPYKSCRRSAPRWCCTGRDQPGAAGATAAGVERARRADDVASELRRGAGRRRPSFSPTRCIDALPVNQAIKQPNGWYERVVEIGKDNKLAFGIAPEVIPLFDQLIPDAVRDAPYRLDLRVARRHAAARDRAPRGAAGRRRAGDRLRSRQAARPARPCRPSRATPS